MAEARSLGCLGHPGVRAFRILHGETCGRAASGDEEEQGEMTGVVGEVGVVGVEPEAEAIGDGADEEIGVGALQATGATEVVELGRAFVILLEEGYVGKDPEMIADLLEGGSVGNSGEDLLTDGADDARAAIGDQLRQGLRVFVGGGAAAQGRGPDGGVYEDIHQRFLRPCLWS